MSGAGGARDGRRLRFTKTELGRVALHPVQDYGELVRNRHAGPRHATMLDDLQASGAQARPFARARQQRVRGLVERGAGQLVAAAADITLDVSLA